MKLGKAGMKGTENSKPLALPEGVAGLQKEDAFTLVSLTHH